MSVYVFMLLQEDTSVSESRPSTTAQGGGGADPLSLDVEDLYVKYKVRDWGNSLQFRLLW